MTDRTKIDVGKNIVYSTKPSGLTTYLMLQPWYDDKNMCATTTCTWLIELSKQNDHDQEIKPDDTLIKINISDWPGALVLVRNTGAWPFQAWTDY